MAYWPFRGWNKGPGGNEGDSHRYIERNVYLWTTIAVDKDATIGQIKVRTAATVTAAPNTCVNVSIV